MGGKEEGTHVKEGREEKWKVGRERRKEVGKK